MSLLRSSLSLGAIIIGFCVHALSRNSLLDWYSFVTIDSFTTKWAEHGLAEFLKWFKLHPIAGTFGFMAVYIVREIWHCPAKLRLVSLAVRHRLQQLPSFLG